MLAIAGKTTDRWTELADIEIFHSKLYFLIPRPTPGPGTSGN